jgi:hypothetical protein
MKKVKAGTVSAKKQYNPIKKMIEDKIAINKALENGENIFSIKGIKFVKPL